MRKRLSMVLSVLLAVAVMGTPVHAAEDASSDTLEMTITSPDGQTTTTVFDLNELAYTITDEDGIMPVISIGEAELKNGWTATFYTSDGTAFYIAGGSTVSFTIKSSNSVHVLMGYKDSDGTKHQTYNGSGKTNTTSISIEDTGYYTMYVTNVSADTMKITGGSISF